MKKSRSLFGATLLISVVIAFTFSYGVDAKEAKREGGMRIDHKIEMKDDILRTKTVRMSEFWISHARITPIEYHQSESRKYRLNSLIDILEDGSVPDEMSLSGSPTNDLPKVFSLSQNYPNPFNPSTTIAFDIPENTGTMQQVDLTVYDIRGRCVRTLINSDLEPGSHKIHWDGRNDHGQSVSSGIYLYILKAGGERITRKMTVLK
jgi:hypothetical protein